MYLYTILIFHILCSRRHFGLWCTYSNSNVDTIDWCTRWRVVYDEQGFLTSNATNYDLFICNKNIAKKLFYFLGVNARYMSVPVWTSCKHKPQIIVNVKYYFWKVLCIPKLNINRFMVAMYLILLGVKFCLTIN